MVLGCFMCIKFHVVLTEFDCGLLLRWFVVFSKANVCHHRPRLPGSTKLEKKTPFHFTVPVVPIGFKFPKCAHLQSRMKILSKC